MHLTLVKSINNLREKLKEGKKEKKGAVREEESLFSNILITKHKAITSTRNSGVDSNTNCARHSKKERYPQSHRTPRLSWTTEIKPSPQG